MDGISAVNNLLINAVNTNMEQMNKMTGVAVQAAVGNQGDDTRAQMMAMLGIGGNFDDLA